MQSDYDCGPSLFAIPALGIKTKLRRTKDSFSFFLFTYKKKKEKDTHSLNIK